MDPALPSEALSPEAAVKHGSRRAALLARFDARFGISFQGALTIVAIVLVLILVSLPRLQSFAAEANEADARGASRALAAQLDPADASLPGLEALSAPLLRELNDAEFLDQGRCLRRHGYLFELLRVPAPQTTGLGRVVPAARPEPINAVLCWPWEAGRTGGPAWIATADGQLFVHPNRERQWSGLELRRALVDARAAWTWNGWSPGR